MSHPTEQESGIAPLDWWSVVYMASGAAMGALGLAWYVPLAALVAFELAEALVRSRRGPLANESHINSAADVVVGMVGWAVVKLFLYHAL